MNIFVEELKDGIKTIEDDTIFKFCTLPHPMVFTLDPYLTRCPGNRSKAENTFLLLKSWVIRAKLDLVLPWSRKGTTLVLTRFTRSHPFSLLQPDSLKVRER